MVQQLFNNLESLFSVPLHGSSLKAFCIYNLKMARKISDLPQKKFSEEMIDNCFFVDKINTSQMSAIPLKSIFDEIIIRAKKEGLKVELMSDKIVILLA